MTHDVAVIGDGPAGSALARACADRGIDVCVYGDAAPWAPTYGTWLDDVEAWTVLADMSRIDDFTTGATDVVAWGERRHQLDRAYTLINNEPLRAALQLGLHIENDHATSVDPQADDLHVTLASGRGARARVVVDATGWPPAFASLHHREREPYWQTAFGVVLAEPPVGDLGTPTLMDFRRPPHPARSADGTEVTTFAYSLPVAGGWLIEETVLAARPALEPAALVDVLASRLGVETKVMLDLAVSTESVRIPMSAAAPRRDQPIVGFGAAAGYVNPVSGYSMSHSLTMAGPVADAISTALNASRSGRRVDTLAIWNAVLPVAQRRSRVLHDYGIDVLAALDGDDVRIFFDAFFDLPTPDWSAYLSTASSPARISAVMTRLFRQASWSTRRHLLRGDPAAFAKFVRPH